MKSRGCYETPGGALIMSAMRELEALTLDRNTLHYKQKLRARLRRDGLQRPVVHAAARGARRVLRRSLRNRTGEIKLRLYKGNIEPLSRKIANSLYSLDIASFTMGASYDQKDALGFINLIGLPIKVQALLKKCKAMKLWGGRFETGPRRSSSGSRDRSISTGG